MFFLWTCADNFYISLSNQLKQYEIINQINKRSKKRGIRETASGRYHARIVFKKKEYNLGVFDNHEEALEARRVAEQKFFGQTFD